MENSSKKLEVMSNHNPNPYDRVRFELYHEILGTLQIVEPLGWDDNDNREIDRNKDLHGIMHKFSNNLRFVGNAKAFIDAVYETYTIQTDLICRKYERDPNDDTWVKKYSGFLDLSTLERGEDSYKCKFNTGGLTEIINSRGGEDVEIERLESMDGIALDAIPTSTVYFPGRRIFLKSKWESKLMRGIENQDVVLTVYSAAGNTRSSAEGFPLNKLSEKSHEQAQAVLQGAEGAEAWGTTGMMLLAVMDRERTFKVTGKNIRFRPFFVRGSYPHSIEYNWCKIELNLTVYENGTDYNVKSRTNIWRAGSGSTTSPSLAFVHNNDMVVNFTNSITLLEGESLALEFLLVADLKFNVGGRRVTVEFRKTELSDYLTIEEDSFFEPTSSKFVFNWDLGNKLVEIISNKKNAFKSDYFNKTSLNEGSLTGAIHGFWVRGFDSSDQSDDSNPNLFRSMTTSWNKFVESMMAIHNVGVGVEEINGKETIVVEDLRYFYGLKVAINLGQVKNVVRKPSNDHFFSSISIGYDKGGDYEEAMGLDEYNGQSKFSTIITKVKNVFTRVSNYRNDSYGREFCRRKPKRDFSTEDTRYDDDIWHLDLKKSDEGDFYIERSYQDDLESIPAGVYSPETATGLRLTPMRLLLKHGWMILTGLYKFPDSFIRYSSSSANPRLVTKIIGQPEISESGNIQNKFLSKNRILPELITFEHKVDFLTEKQLYGFTVIDGKKVPNFYLLVEFTNENNKKERGWIMNLKPAGKGQWTILKANL